MKQNSISIVEGNLTARHAKRDEELSLKIVQEMDRRMIQHFKSTAAQTETAILKAVATSNAPKPAPTPMPMSASIGAGSRGLPQTIAFILSIVCVIAVLQWALAGNEAIRLRSQILELKQDLKKQAQASAAQASAVQKLTGDRNAKIENLLKSLGEVAPLVRIGADYLEFTGDSGTIRLLRKQTQREQ